jgi:hypothetical protein
MTKPSITNPRNASAIANATSSDWIVSGMSVSRFEVSLIGVVLYPADPAIDRARHPEIEAGVADDPSELPTTHRLLGRIP